jgi:hypothetical protein
LAERQCKEDQAVAIGSRDRWAHRQEMAMTRADSSTNPFATVLHHPFLNKLPW